MIIKSDNRGATCWHEKDWVVMKRRWFGMLVRLAGFCLFVLTTCAAETNAPVIHIGVLAHRGEATCLAEWSPTVAWLQEQIPECRFELLPCNHASMQERVKRGELDLVLTSPALYVELEYQHGLHRIATLVMGRGALASSELHGAIFCLADQTTIRALRDVKGHTVAAVDKTAFGGYAMQARELQQVGVDVGHDVKALQFLGTQDLVIAAVLQRQAEIGFVRADLLERLISERKISRDTLRVLPPLRDFGRKHAHAYPYSTRAYPEWPMAVTHDLPNVLVKRVAIALFSMSPESPAMQAAGATGWMTPENYQEVHNCLRELRLPPYEHLDRMTLLEAARKLWPVLAGLIIAGLAGALLRRAHNQKRLVTLVADRTAALRHSNDNLQREIAERKQAEENNLRMAAIVTSSEDAIYSKDLDGNILSWNQGAVRLYGYTVSEMLGKPVSILIPETHVEEMVELMRQFWAGQRIEHLETLRRKKDGTLVDISLTISPIFDLSGAITGASIIARDITARKQLELSLRESKEAAEAANQAKSEFLANMSHEIRTPLNAIIGFGELLAGLPLNDKQRSYVDPIRTAGRSLLRLLNDLLDLSKIEAGRMELQLTTVDLRLLLEEVNVIFAPRILQKGVQFQLVIDPALPGALLLDEIRVRQVLVNLVGNALKFTDHGSVVVRVAQHFTNAEHTSVDLVIAVEDTGIGIRTEELEHIFGAFRQQSAQSAVKYGGTGLGLTISRRLAEMMHGTIAVTSELGHGSTFSLRLPAVAVAAHTLAGPDVLQSERLPIASFHFHGERVLVVDDVASNRVMLRALLEQSGLSVFEAQDGATAIALAEEVQPAVVLMDLHMPGMSGFQATLAIKQRPTTQATPVLALTASIQELDAMAQAQAGFAGYFVKPVAAAVLLQALQNTLAAHTPQDTARPAQESTDAPPPLITDAMPAIPAEQRLALLRDAEALHQGIVVSRVHRLVTQLTEVGTTYHAAPLTTLAQQLAKQAAKMDVTGMKQVVQVVCHLLSPKT